MTDYQDGNYVSALHINELQRKSEGYGILSGLDVTTGTGLNLIVSTGSAIVGYDGSYYKRTITSPVTVSVDSHLVYPKKSCVYISLDGNISVSTGTTASILPVGTTGRDSMTPISPTIPSNSVLLSEIWISAGATDGSDLTLYPSEIRKKKTNIISPQFSIGSTGIKTVVTPHSLSFAPDIEDVSVTIIEDTPSDNWNCGYVKVSSADASNITCKVNITDAAPTSPYFDWDYYKAVTINSSSQSTRSDFQKKFKIHYGTLSSGSFLKSLNFERDINNPYMIPNGGWEGTENIADELIIEESDHLRMYYGGDLNGDQKGGMGLATASKYDYPPKVWTRYGGNPVYTNSDGTYVRIGSVNKVDGVYYLHYQDGINGVYVGLATSTNGINWTKWGRVLTNSGDETTVEDAYVIVPSDSSHWYMYYSYRTGAKTLPGIRVATSGDGKYWTRISGDVLTTGSAGTPDSKYIEHHQVFYKYGVFYIIYEAYNNVNWSCNLAYNTSTTPTGSFTKHLGNPVLERSAISGSFDQHHVATPHLFNHSDSWYMFFCGGASVSYADSFWCLSLAYNNENIYLNNKCKTDFGDIRFADGNDSLSYWTETKTDGDFATFWVKITQSLESSPQTIYVYYGNSTATSIDNGSGTFVFFDDFTGSSLDTTLWPSNQYVTLGNGIATFSTGSDATASTESYAFGTQTFDINKSMEIYLKPQATTTQARMGLTVNRTHFSTGTYNICASQFYGYMYADTNDGYTAITNSNFGTYSAIWQREKMRWMSGTSGSVVVYYKDENNMGYRLWGTGSRDSSQHVPTGSDMKLLLRDKMEVDWIFIRNSYNLEPNTYEWTGENTNSSTGTYANLGIKIDV